MHREAERPYYSEQLYALTVLCVKPNNKQCIDALRVIVHNKAVYHARSSECVITPSVKSGNAVRVCTGHHNVRITI